ncbi:unnamed protein product [Brachionus calyciflorus]|uniref:Reverse transcriptase domain-containing protein n=1 Tax=Brachionus calyciflorus TaxID=104777 RepID=A0A813SNI0_9BILA|nr:unnamed protein product [Brachionus calyciflorus]
MILGDLEFAEVYMDDITIHSIDFISHCKHIKKVLKRLKKANLKINPRKCKWFAKQIRLLGHVVSNKLVKMDPSKIDAIVKRLRPKTLKQLQSFLGLCNFYRRFIMNYSLIAQPLFYLCSKSIKFEWSDECETAFNELKKKLSSYPVLRLPDVNKTFFLTTDASGYGKTELHGAKVIAMVDHAALVYLKSIKNPTGRLARWIIFLQEFDFDIIYKKGSTLANADTFSRRVIDYLVTVEYTEVDKIVISSVNIKEVNQDEWEDANLLHSIQFNKIIAGLSK